MLKNIFLILAIKKISTFFSKHTEKDINMTMDSQQACCFCVLTNSMFDSRDLGGGVFAELRELIQGLQTVHNDLYVKHIHQPHYVGVQRLLQTVRQHILVLV